MSVQGAARMDAIYARQRHIYDLTRKYYLLGRDRLIERLDVPAGGTVLEIGCGTGRNLISVARRYPKARLFGLDISEAMLATARRRVKAAGLDHQLVLQQGDATDFDAEHLFGRDRFDRVFFSYTLSMIPDWQSAMAMGASVTDGQMSLVDFGQQESLPKHWQRALFAWLGKFDVSPRKELLDEASRIADDLRMKYDGTRLYRGYAWSAELTR